MNPKPDREKVESMKSLRTALRTLREFGGDQRDFGVAELAERCDISKGQMSKILAAFAESGLLIQDPQSRRYSVGARMFALGSRFVTHDRLCREAIPAMRELVARTGHSARLSVLDGDDVLYLLGIEGPLFIDTGWRAGTWLPVHSTAAGRVLLAFMEPERAARVIERAHLRAVTSRTLTDRAQIRKFVQFGRMRGYVTQRGETTEGLGVIAVPVFGEGTQALAALSLAFPSHLVSAEDETDLADILHSSARVLSQRIGGTVYPFGTRRSSGTTPNRPVFETPVIQVAAVPKTRSESRRRNAVTSRNTRGVS
jgi:IclR family KDG regulon transcriptional repressor